MAKKDDRRDNVDRIQENIDNTFENMHDTEAIIRATKNDSTKEELEEKNKRRKKAIDGMRNEIKEEAYYRENGGQ